ncbi:MAG TPA: DUF370 domain-containing protein [Pseudothermotoga sp.]|nr:DUF370 domain-containing protein [Pseudothermotoga sp.]HOK84117.1 DUF370 domain-containing protein [Pseudothermotoga sp.]HPP69116.1 DUF370 domain-containing protein [Pseudothermotoga sp.]
MFVQVTRGVYVNRDRVRAVISINNITAKQMRETASFSNKMLNLTYGAQARSVIITDSGHVLLLGEKANRIKQRLFKRKEQDQQSH